MANFILFLVAFALASTFVDAVRVLNYTQLAVCAVGLGVCYYIYRKLNPPSEV